MSDERKWRAVLFVPMVVAELLLLAANWMVGVISPKAGARFIRWNIRTLPDKEWYYGRPRPK